MLLFLILNSLSIILLYIGFWGLLIIRSNLIVIILSIELILFAIILNLLSYSGYFDDLISQLFILFILVIAAAESVIGLSLTVSVYRLRGSLDINVYTVLKG